MATPIGPCAALVSANTAGIGGRVRAGTSFGRDDGACLSDADMALSRAFLTEPERGGPADHCDG